MRPQVTPVYLYSNSLFDSQTHARQIWHENLAVYQKGCHGFLPRSPDPLRLLPFDQAPSPHPIGLTPL